jgi:hypothetical protein
VSDIADASVGGGGTGRSLAVFPPVAPVVSAVGGGGGGDSLGRTGERASFDGGDTGTGSSSTESTAYSTAVGRFSNKRGGGGVRASLAGGETGTGSSSVE